ncbi:hypothetical protein ANO14919_089870 [Xylariales sp. No.14919]|nr:hypothetical protein ANO14919_089870 [Xylariales sp. No.14919]
MADEDQSRQSPTINSFTDDGEPTPATRIDQVHLGRNRRQFAESIRQFSTRKGETYLFSGEHYQFLTNFFDQPPLHDSFTRYPATEQNFSPVILHPNRSGPDPDLSIPSGVAEDIAQTLLKCVPTAHSSLLVLMSGWQRNDTLRIAAQCGVDPELFRRHLRFLDPNRFFDLPTLPSKATNIWCPRFTTICKRQDPLSLEAVIQQREAEFQGLRAYLNDLRTNQRIGSSIVRRYAILDETTSVVQQDVSFGVHQKGNGGWIGTIWIDSGRSFEGPLVPWLDQRAEDTDDPYVPLIHHLPKVAIATADPVKPGDPTRDTPETIGGRYSPSLSILPRQYGSSLDRAVARTDAFYAFGELMSLAASSDCQFLNLLQQHMDVSSRSFRGQEDWPINNLHYMVRLLEDIEDRARQVLSLIGNEQHSDWPRASCPEMIRVRDTSKRLLTDDYQDILRRSADLAQRGRCGIDFITTDISTRASQRSFDQAKEVNRLTLLAFFFLPLSFVTSIFGMNIATFQDLRWGIGSIFMALIVVLVPSFTLLSWGKWPEGDGYHVYKRDGK